MFPSNSSNLLLQSLVACIVGCIFLTSSSHPSPPAPHLRLTLNRYFVPYFYLSCICTVPYFATGCGRIQPLSVHIFLSVRCNATRLASLTPQSEDAAPWG